MNQTKSSGIAILALMAFGGAAVAGFQVLRSKPELLSLIPTNVRTKLLGNQDGSWKDRLIDSNKPPLQSLKNVEQALWEMYKNNPVLAEQPEEELVQRVGQLVAFANASAVRIQEDNDHSDEEKRNSQLIALRATFVGATYVPCEFEKTFQEQAQAIISAAPKSTESAQAQVLQILRRHSFKKPISSNLMRDLDRFIQIHGRGPIGASLYSCVAYELWAAQQAPMAKQVLEHGIRTYSGTRFSGKLVNQLVDQGHRPPPEPAIDPKAWKSYLGIAEKCATSRSNGGSGDAGVTRVRFG